MIVSSRLSGQRLCQCLENILMASLLLVGFSKQPLSFTENPQCSNFFCCFIFLPLWCSLKMEEPSRYCCLPMSRRFFWDLNAKHIHYGLDSSIAGMVSWLPTIFPVVFLQLLKTHFHAFLAVCDCVATTFTLKVTWNQQPSGWNMEKSMDSVSESYIPDEFGLRVMFLPNIWSWSEFWYRVLIKKTFMQNRKKLFLRRLLVFMLMKRKNLGLVLVHLHWNSRKCQSGIIFKEKKYSSIVL